MSDTPKSTRRDRLVDALLWLVVIACLPVLVGGIAMAPPDGFWRGLVSSEPSAEASGPRLASFGQTLPEATPAPAPLTKPIDQITLGDRVLGDNPQVSDADRLHVEEVEPATWRKLTLTMTKDDGSSLSIQLLRSVAWLEDMGVEVGGEIYLDMNELVASGFAEVLSIEPCPPIGPGEGHVVTGFYVHERREVISLKLEGETEPIRVTTNHLFWSADREAFVPAEHLAVGELVETLHGKVAIDSIGARGPPDAVETVYNLEVNGEHVYRVGSAGVLVHNCTPPFVQIVGKLSRQASDDLRAEARAVWKQTAGRWAASDGLQIHHRTPLEWAHLFPNRNPNEKANLLGVRREVHEQVSEMWAKWKGELGGRNPTPQEVEDMARVVDKVFANEWVFIK